jgi:hypothetical protein
VGRLLWLMGRRWCRLEGMEMDGFCTLHVVCRVWRIMNTVIVELFLEFEHLSCLSDVVATNASFTKTEG